MVLPVTWPVRSKLGMQAPAGPYELIMAKTVNPNKKIEETLSEHSRRLTMLEDVFAPMAKLAMELIVGKPGEPGMAENLRNVNTNLQELVDAHAKDAADTQRIRADGFKRLDTLDRWRKQVEEKKQTDKEITLMGMKMGADTRLALINGAFILLGIFVTWFLSR
jgi:hypothetical protein